MIIAATLSKPRTDAADTLGRPYIKIRIRRKAAAALAPQAEYAAEFFTKTQAFQKTLSQAEAETFLARHAGTTFKNAVEQTEDEEITIMANRHGEIKTLRRKLRPGAAGPAHAPDGGNRLKNYILPQGTPVPFLVRLGIMTRNGTVAAAKYDKFRQINRFLEFIRDIVPEVSLLAEHEPGGQPFSPERPLRVADFGCGKSYLTFAAYHYLARVMGLPVQITGLDLKEDVIATCQTLAQECGYEGLQFAVGDIANFAQDVPPDIIITLHACDTATDHALRYAVACRAKAILSVPCCQHEINQQLEAAREPLPPTSPFASLTRYGIIRERLAALATDALRAELLEQQGYAVQVLEFIDMEHTPKNVLLRAVRKRNAGRTAERSQERAAALLNGLHVSHTLSRLLSASTEERQHGTDLPAPPEY